MNCWDCNCFLIGTNNQGWLGFRAEPPCIRTVCWSLEMRERGAKSPSGYDSQGKLPLCLGTLPAQETEFPFSDQKKRSPVCYSWGSADRNLSGSCRSRHVTQLMSDKPEAQMKGDKRTTKDILSAFHQHARLRRPFLSKGK